MKSILLIAVALKGLCGFAGGGGAVDGGQVTTALKLLLPADGAKVSLLTERQKQHLALPFEQRVAGFDDAVARAKVASIGCVPAPVTFVWTGVSAVLGPAEIEIRRADDDRAVRTVDVSRRMRNAWSVMNLETGVAYAWRVKIGDMVSRWSRFETEPGPRLVSVEDVPNFRDVGGAVGLDGRRVRQGLLYRSAGANANATTNKWPGASRVTEKGRCEAVEFLGIRTDLDLRTDGECRGMTGSPFGEKVKWVQVSSGCYQWMGEKENRAAFVRCFRTVNDPKNLPLVFHCIGGQDRTGTLAFILNALLGVSEHDLSLDWEMTVFWNPTTGWFSRKQRYEAMQKYFNDTYRGRTINEKVEQYVLDCGIARDEIDGFRNLMLEPTASAAAHEPVKVIFDTDMITDFDDVGALACLHAMADAGECEILATVSSTRGNASVGAVEVINAYYGRGDLPVGAPKGMGVIGAYAGAKEKVDPKSPLGAKTGGDGGHYKYRKLVADYPQWVKHVDADDAPDANEVYRKVLAAAPDKSVVICSVGFLTNLRRLLETKSDAISPLDGKALVAQKVKCWTAMACNYPRGREYNSKHDWESSKIVLENWPTPVVFSDFQYGMDCFAGRAVAEMKGPRNPVKDVFAGTIPSRAETKARAAALLCGCYGMGGRAAWDETAVLAAVRGPEKYFNVHRGTYRMVGTNGDDEWSPDEENGPHVRITEKLSKTEVGKIIDELICRGPAR